MAGMAGMRALEATAGMAAIVTAAFPTVGTGATAAILEMRALRDCAVLQGQAGMVAPAEQPEQLGHRSPLEATAAMAGTVQMAVQTQP